MQASVAYTNRKSGQVEIRGEKRRIAKTPHPGPPVNPEIPGHFSDTRLV
jgi:hypothetical protein